VHFDPVASSGSPSVRRPSIESEDIVEREIEEEQQEPKPRGREGLPPAFRMRHQRHYVEQLMGDAPIRTVREIGLADIEPPPDDPRDLQDLEASIRRLGVLEPLLVRPEGRAYRVIAGLSRLRAARNAGLRSVPCIVHDVDDDMMNSMREASLQRAPVPTPEPVIVEVPRQQASLPPAFSEVTAGLNFVSALLPAITAAGEDRFRWSVLSDLAGIELLRARTVAAAAEILANGTAVSRTDVTAADVLRRVSASVATEARLRGVQFELTTPDIDYRIEMDAALIETAITGLFQSMLALLPQGGGAIRVTARGTTVRPALILQLSQESVDLTAEGERRFFDGDWREHPAGPAAALLLAGAARVARLHGGRIDVQPLPMKGCTVTFVIPKLIGC
jgi:hypothetical protein